MPIEKNQTKGARPDCPARCVYCGSPLQVVWVHGHGQCARCGVNVDPCCGGAPLDEETAGEGSPAEA